MCHAPAHCPSHTQTHYVPLSLRRSTCPSHTQAQYVRFVLDLTWLANHLALARLCWQPGLSPDLSGGGCGWGCRRRSEHPSPGPTPGITPNVTVAAGGWQHINMPHSYSPVQGCLPTPAPSTSTTHSTPLPPASADATAAAAGPAAAAASAADGGDDGEPCGAPCGALLLDGPAWPLVWPSLLVGSLAMLGMTPILVSTDPGPCPWLWVSVDPGPCPWLWVSMDLSTGPVPEGSCGFLSFPWSVCRAVLWAAKLAGRYIIIRVFGLG